MANDFSRYLKYKPNVVIGWVITNQFYDRAGKQDFRFVIANRKTMLKHFEDLGIEKIYETTDSSKADFDKTFKEIKG